MKKNYVKPEMKVYELKRQQQLLVDSPIPGYGGPIGYAPGIDADMNKTA